MITNKQKAHMKEVLEEVNNKFNEFCKDLYCKDCPFDIGTGHCYISDLQRTIKKNIKKLNIKTCKHCGKPLEED